MSDEKDQSRKPEDSDFKQQRLKAWQPLLTPQYVISTFFIVGLIFIPIGIIILVYSSDVVEIRQRYDNLSHCATNTICLVNVTVPKDMKRPIYFYYELGNYYQNHRRYVKSRSDAQLRGDVTSGISACDPIEYNANGQAFYPCGLIANSFFNDTFDGSYCPGGSLTSCTSLSGSNWDRNGIAWSSDVDYKFKYVNVTGRADVTTQGYFGNQLPDVNNEELIVWMRTAGLPTFRKLHRKIRDMDFNKGDVISVNILNVYPVTSFSGEKSIVFSTTTWLGGKNEFLGWAYIVVGALSIILAVIFLFKHRVAPRPLGDMKYFNWSTPANKASDGTSAE